MKATGIVRKLDSLGRIVVPSEIRKKFEYTKNQGLSVWVDGNTIILKKHTKDNVEIISKESAKFTNLKSTSKDVEIKKEDYSLNASGFTYSIFEDGKEIGEVDFDITENNILLVTLYDDKNDILKEVAHKILDLVIFSGTYEYKIQKHYKDDGKTNILETGKIDFKNSSNVYNE